MKVTINLPANALKMADEAAERMCLSRSAFISLCIAEKFRQDAVIETLPQMLSELQALRTLADKDKKES